MPIEIRPMNSGEDEVCGNILRSLPDWFGIEEAILDYVRATRSMETWIAESAGEVVGFLTLLQHNEHSAEIHVMAVVSDLHGRGCGRRLVERAEDLLRSRSVEFLQVKTLAPSDPSAAYARTRGFYERLGFRPLEESLLWGEANPCLVMIKHLAGPGVAR